MKIGNVITIIVFFMIVVSMLIPIAMQHLTVENDCCEDINYYVPSVSTSIKIGMSEHVEEPSIDVHYDNNVLPAIEENGTCN